MSYSLTPPKTCQNIIGFDANALYLSTFMQDMPTGSPIRCRAERNFTPELADTYGRKAYAWLEYVAVSEGIKIQHQFNNTDLQKILLLILLMVKHLHCAKWVLIPCYSWSG